ncbi:serine/threonine-protein kinase [Luteimonas kalidii]|uniref:Serine/threonine-protein kinase n=1 Tax=Luteimonas kalidii TaxID=3042025 RepID=A0ABT6JYC3_9GAMM|nr:serine/threonine-protein kinase [Luteimonas kalidii]MDH5835703.1 serine/threonine-protein kinase [Luteimonas kalidii]
MSVADEGQVLDWFERALDRPAAERVSWLSTQAVPDWLRLRVLRLLQAESDLGGFLEQPVLVPEPDGFPQLGERVGPFQLVERIDSGGMGVVYRARRADEAYDQDVALKLIRPLHLGANAGFRAQLIARFENERALLARLGHPNIARILDGGSTASGLPWLAMELVDGLSLVAYCDRHALDIPARLALFRKVCDGVQEAHRHLIVHRDLKPENILVDAAGEPKLLDFGIARLLDAGDEAGAVSVTSLTAMTPAYASPEQVRRQPTTTRSDVYSLGVLLYQLLTGVRPYELAGLSPAEAERTVCDTRPRSLRVATDAAALDDDDRRRRLAGIDGDLERIVARAMHKDIERRYGSSEELARDIQRWLDGRPVLAHPDSAAYRFGKFVRRHRVGSTLAIAALVAIVSAGGIAAWQAHQAAADMRQVNAFLMDVLSMSDPFETGGELTLGQALDGAAERIDEYFPGRPDLSAEVRFGIGYSMLDRHRLPQAEAQLVRALQDHERVFGRDDARTLRALEGVAGLRQDQARIAEAEALFIDGIARSERAGLVADPIHLYLLNNLGMLYMAQDRYAEAGTYLQRAHDAWTAHHDTGEPSADQGNLLSNLAQVAHERKDVARADRLYREAQAIFEVLYPRGSPDLAIAIGNRGLLAEEQGDASGALALYRQSLAMRERVFEGDHPMVAVALTHVARMAAATGDTADALDHALRAVAMADRVHVQPSPRHASAYGTLAEARLAGGDARGAREALTRAYALLARLEAPPPSVATYLARVKASLCAAPGAIASCPEPATAADAP